MRPAGPDFTQFRTLNGRAHYCRTLEVRPDKQNSSVEYTITASYSRGPENLSVLLKLFKRVDTLHAFTS
jgi:hypothetical protein